MQKLQFAGEGHVLPLLFALNISAQVPAAPNGTDPIVVIGQRIDDASADLQSCLARACKPDEDIAATLRLAETQLLAGKYRDARKTLLSSLGRNEEFAMAYPVPVSELY